MKRTRLFGTDGIRGVAGEYPLDERTVFVIGRALGEFLRRGRAAPRVAIGRDTRESSGWIADALAAGLADGGVASLSAGVIPTAGVAYLSRNGDFSAGVMISASHNPYRDNGIKLFGPSGYKLPDEEELQVEEAIFKLAPARVEPSQEQATVKPGRTGPGLAGGNNPAASAAASTAQARAGLLPEDASLKAGYEDFLCALLPAEKSLAELRVVLDCANGAASAVAPEVFRRLGATVTAIHAAPDGRNINQECGSLHPEALQARVPAERADLGVAFDGDADRALFVTAAGKLVDGDGVLFMAATHLLAEGRLNNRQVVGTIMSNLGLEAALGRIGVRLVRTPVGDKYVLEEMLRSGCNLGGEQSGHVIFGDDHTTGDGLLTALHVMDTVVSARRPLDTLVAGLRPFPQVIRNVRVREKVPLEQLPEVMDAIRASQEHFGLTGRVIVRYSGTEPLARIMIEAEDEGQVRSHAEAIAAAFARSIGQ